MSPVFKVPSHISVLQQNASKSILSMDTSVQKLKTYINESTDEEFLRALKRSCERLSSHLQRFVNYHEQQQHTVYSSNSSASAQSFQW